MSLRPTRRAWLRMLGGAALAALGSACASAARPNPTAPPVDPSAAGTPGTAPPLTATLANSELAVGQNRLALGVFESGRPVSAGTVTLELFQLEGATATKRSDARAVYRGLEGGRGIWVANVVFDQPGAWGVQTSLARPDRPLLATRRNLEVLPTSSAPMPGQPAIPSRNPTARDVPDPAAICSAQPPCDLHVLSIATALGLGKPLVIAFSTPGYCTTQTCGPVLAEVRQVKRQREAQASFVHVEIYKDPRTLAVADAVTEWNLQSEPWVFVVDRRGTIATRIESITTADEIDAALTPLL